MPKFRTPKSKRATYIYKDATGRTIEITPGMLGDDGQAVTTDHIILLHAEDDAIHNVTKRDEYYGLSSFERSDTDDGKGLADKRLDLADYTYDPETLLLSTLDAAERSGVFTDAWDKLTDKQRNLIMKKLLKRSNVDIAKEEGVTETAIRNRSAKIQKRFQKFLL